MDARTILQKVKEKSALSTGEARWFGHALATSDISDAQAGAFAMAVCLNGLGAEARVALTEGMRDSGDVLSWDLPGPVLDKHSTGGVGDPVSLVLAPALAEAGAFVPMISGRGLGHTGGTLDKLEAIPGYICDIGPQRLAHVVKTAGCAIVGATGRVAPSDKRLYAIRDVTASVASIDLITASILSKKLAAGLDGLVLDVKTGSGAFMEAPEEAKALAKSLVEVANGVGCPTRALITDMNQPLADAAGNALEVMAVMRCLTDGSDTPLRQVTSALGGQLLASSGLASTAEKGREKVESIIASGAAAERFEKMVAAMGGPDDFAESWRNRLPEASVFQEVFPTVSGYVATVDCRALGEVVVALGGGRRQETDRIDPSVGLSQIARIGTKLDPKTPMAMVHATTEAKANAAAAQVRRAFTLTRSQPKLPDLIHSEVSP